MVSRNKQQQVNWWLTMMFQEEIWRKRCSTSHSTIKIIVLSCLPSHQDQQQEQMITLITCYLDADGVKHGWWRIYTWKNETACVRILLTISLSKHASISRNNLRTAGWIFVFMLCLSFKSQRVCQIHFVSMSFIHSVYFFLLFLLETKVNIYIHTRVRCMDEIAVIWYAKICEMWKKVNWLRRRNKGVKEVNKLSSWSE